MTRTLVGASVALVFAAAALTACGGRRAGIEEDIDRILAASFEPDEPGAAVIVVKDDSVIYRGGYGLADLELGVPVRPDLVFRIGSETKSFTAVAVMILVERGALALDEAIREHLADLPLRFDSVTIRQLLSHTSGVPEMFEEPYYDLMEEKFFALVNDEVEVDDFLDLIVHRDFDFAPGSAFAYSNGGYYLLGRLVEQASGLEYERFLSQAIFEPLDLGSTRYYSNVDVVRGRVPGYLDDDTVFIRNPYASLSGSILYAAGGLLSSVDDLARFHLALHGGELLNPVNTEALFTPETREFLSGTTQYGLGFFIGRLKGKTIYWHGGDAYGFHASSYYLPDERAYVAILSNNPRRTTRDLDPMAKRIAALVAGDPFREWQPVTLRPDELARLAGTYRIGASSVREVIVDGDRIYTRRDGGRRLEVFPASADTLFYTSSLSFITFEEDERGEVVRMVMHRETGEDEVAAKER
ncbi:MAG: serine hydrolase [Gemmatimonadota bacterium]|nr:MAG: serine hydrolase [Gemmatimonadota bacterium]